MKHLNRVNQWVQRGKKIREMDLLTGIVVLIACFFVGALAHDYILFILATHSI